MSDCGTRIVLRGQKPLTLCDRCPCFGSLFPPLAALTFAASLSLIHIFHPYVRAQETANHCDVRWVALRNAAGEGMLVVGEEPLSVSAWNFPICLLYTSRCV